MFSTVWEPHQAFFWVKAKNVSAGTVPGLVWTVVCGATGKTVEQAKQGYDYWQLEINKFPTFLRILQ